MGLNIKNDVTHALVRELAALTGESQTEAVTVAVRMRLAGLRQGSTSDRTQRILELGRAVAATLPAELMRVEDLYDERGLPA